MNSRHKQNRMVLIFLLLPGLGLAIWGYALFGNEDHNAKPGIGVINFNGVYVASPSTSSQLCMKFYKNGIVKMENFSLDSSLEQITSMIDKFTPDNNVGMWFGRYAVEGDTIKFTAASKLYTSDYQGKIIGRRIDLDYVGHSLDAARASEIRRGSVTCRFVEVP